MTLRINSVFSFLAMLSTPAAHAFTYEDITGLIQSRNLTKLEQVLPLLPEEMRASFTLMRESRSLQAAAPDAPRVVLFQPDGRLTCSFNGDPGQSGYDSLECVQFRDDERAFDFRQIVFPTPENGWKTVQFSDRNETIRGTVSCTACHGADPRPNWDSYNQWKGAYGENDDHVDPNMDQYRAFRERSYEHPRYRWLIRELNSYAPYRLSSTDFEIMHRPNLRLSETYGRLNALRAARILEERLPAWERWAYAVAALHCELTEAQLAILQKAGITPSELALSKIFRDVGLPYYEWSTEFYPDQQDYPGKPWEHQTGLSMFSEAVAMAFVQSRAREGNAALAEALRKLDEYYGKVYSGDDLRVRQALNEIVPVPDYFGQGYQENLALVCPETTRDLIEAVGKR